MKRFVIFLATAAALLLAASCSKEFSKGSVSENGGIELVFSVDLPAATRAVDDGSAATRLHFAVYDAEGNYLQNLSEVTSTISGSASPWTVKVPVVMGITYRFVFFADAPTSPYTFDAVNKKLTVDSFASNNDIADAFFNTKEVHVTASASEPVVLKRPFAQINFAAPSADIASAGDVLDLTGMVTGITVTGVYSEFNLLTGVPSGSAATKVFAAAAPVGDVITVDGINYDRIAMAYVLVGDEQLSTATLDLNIPGESDYDLECEVPNVPLKKNYRTNVIGNIFTKTYSFTVTVDSDFDAVDGYASYYVPTYASIAALNTAFASGPMWYKVALVTPESGTIVLPRTPGDVQIFMRGDFSGNDITIEYAAGATAADKPANLYISAPALNALNGSLPATNVVISADSDISSGTLLN